MADITELLHRAANGDAVCADALMPLVYERLSAIARKQLAKNKQWTLSTTGLVHEAYLELFGPRDIGWHDRNHFFAYAATAMRHLLINRAQQKLAEKHGGKLQRQDIADVPEEIAVYDECVQIIALDQVLRRMAEEQPRFVKVIEMRFFAGLSVDEVATALNIDTSTVKRDWQKARALIAAVIEENGH